MPCRGLLLILILQFIYTGEVDVPTDEITDFLAVANNLDISELKNSPQSSSKGSLQKKKEDI